ncbi:MAG: DNA polymerase III subunit gamma/tau [Deltaproteobacteria bacterium]|nr:DNA polymerase III subunit gamma/tau [Deltaproteobacteria bacterium]
MTEPAQTAPTNAAYLVLARKYRPQKFVDLTGQEHVVRTLSNALKSGRIAHALLFTGPRGCGKTTSARIVARALNCVGPEGTFDKPPLEPCGVCAPCKEIAQGTDVDVQEIDAASNNGVDDVRQLREAAKYLPARDRYKIYIVDEVHMLSAAAFNALLKTLEEPPGHIKFLLATTDPQKLPATILSRVQRHNFQLVPLGKIVTRLREIAQAEHVQVSDGALSLVARQAMGSMRDALSLLDQLFGAHDPAAGEIGDVEAAETLGALDRSVVAGAVSAVLARDPAAAMQALQKAYGQGAEFKRLAEEIAGHARNLLLAALPNVTQDLPDHELRALSQEAQGSDPAQLARVFELLQQAQDEVAEAPNPRHALEVALLRAVYLAPAGNLPELVGKVEQLAQKLGVQGPARSDKSPRVSRGLNEGAPLRASVEDVPTAYPVSEPPPQQTPTPAQTLTQTLPPALPPTLPPASPPSRSADLISALPLDQAWKLLLESVRASRKMMLVAVLEHAIPIELSSNGVVLALPRSQSGMFTDQDNRKAVETAFERVIGKRAPLVIKDASEVPMPPQAASLASVAVADAGADASMKSVADQKKEQRAKASAARVAQGKAHPSVRAAMDLLGGEIEDVRDLGEE